MSATEKWGTEGLKGRVDRCLFGTYRVGGARTIHLAKPYPDNFPMLCGVNNNVKDAVFMPEYGHRMCPKCLKASGIEP